MDESLTDRRKRFLLSSQRYTCDFLYRPRKRPDYPRRPEWMNEEAWMKFLVELRTAQRSVGPITVVLTPNMQLTPWFLEKLGERPFPQKRKVEDDG